MSPSQVKNTLNNSHVLWKTAKRYRQVASHLLRNCRISCSETHEFMVFFSLEWFSNWSRNAENLLTLFLYLPQILKLVNFRREKPFDRATSILFPIDLYTIICGVVHLNIKNDQICFMSCIYTSWVGMSLMCFTTKSARDSRGYRHFL